MSSQEHTAEQFTRKEPPLEIWGVLFLNYMDISNVCTRSRESSLSKRCRCADGSDDGSSDRGFNIAGGPFVFDIWDLDLKIKDWLWRSNTYWQHHFPFQWLFVVVYETRLSSPSVVNSWAVFNHRLLFADLAESVKTRNTNCWHYQCWCNDIQLVVNTFQNHFHHQWVKANSNSTTSCRRSIKWEYIFTIFSTS